MKEEKRGREKGKDKMQRRREDRKGRGEEGRGR
jgi:hypothetical protein